MMFATTMDAKELALIDRVARKVSPAHFYDGGPPVAQAINDAGRERAREIAQEIIAIVRAADSSPRANEHEGETHGRPPAIA